MKENVSRLLNESQSFGVIPTPEAGKDAPQAFLPISYESAPYTSIRSPIDKTKELSQWTKNLVDCIKSPNLDQSSVNFVTSASVISATFNAGPVVESLDKTVAAVVKDTAQTENQVKIPNVIQRIVLNPDESLKEFGLDSTLEQLTENIRVWFSKMILKPLAKDIDEVTAAFSKAGFDHLNPYHPASFGIPMTNTSLNGQSILKNMITITPVAGSQPQSLVDLAQSHKNDLSVQKRLKIERYLSFASLAARRTHVISRIQALAKDNYMTAFSPSEGLDSDTDILLCLFCTFMDENLPSSDFFDNSPFSSKYFKPMGETPSSNSDAIQIAHVAFQSFQLIAGKYVFTSYTGPNNLFHIIIFMVEFVHCHRGGFLGIGNLNSRAINLTSIFGSNTN